jgi:hypothetical protein
VCTNGSERVSSTILRSRIIWCHVCPVLLLRQVYIVVRWCLDVTPIYVVIQVQYNNQWNIIPSLMGRQHHVHHAIHYTNYITQNTIIIIHSPITVEHIRSIMMKRSGEADMQANIPAITCEYNSRK